jgi:hypothetical protein
MTRSRRLLIPHSSYYIGPPPLDSAYHTDPIGQIGLHHPREIIRVERDYSGGELVQFASTYPLELEGRVRRILFYIPPDIVAKISLSSGNTNTVSRDRQRDQRVLDICA